MNEIEKLIGELCPDGVEFQALGDVCLSKENIKWKDHGKSTFMYVDLTSVDRVTHKITDTKSINSDNAPSRAQQILKEGDVLFGTTRPTLQRYSVIGKEYDGQICSTGFCVLRPNKKKVLTNFIFHLVGSLEFYDYVDVTQKGASYPAISDAEVKNYRIPVPPLKVQHEIVRILDSFTELEAELEARKKQYEYYRNQLLTFDEDACANIVSASKQASNRKLTLVDIAHFSNLRINSTNLNKHNYVGVDNLLQNRAGKKTSIYVPNSGKLTRFDNGDILIGNIRPYLKKIWKADISGGTNGDVLVIKINDNEQNSITSGFLFYYLSCDKFFEYDMQFAKGTKMPRGDKAAIMKYPVTIPSIAEQNRIVAILDKFDALVHDISDGLPAELAARRQQYEYYRNKLLTFEELPR